MRRDLAVREQPMVSLKVGYILTDLPVAGNGEPRRRPRGSQGDVSPRIDEAVELTAATGGAVIFDRPALGNNKSVPRADWMHQHVGGDSINEHELENVIDALADGRE